MKRLEPVVTLSGGRMAICYPGNKGAKIVQVVDGNPVELFDLSVAELQEMADAKHVDGRFTLDECLSIVLAWISNRV